MDASETRDYRLISCNDHIVLDPHAFDGHLSAADRGRIKLELLEAPAHTLVHAWVKQGYALRGRSDEIVRGHLWDFDGVPFFTCKSSIVEDTSDLRFDEVVPPFDYNELPKRFYDPIARLEVLDRDGVLASATFPMIEFPGYGGEKLLQHTDPAFAFRVVRAYNDWILDDFVAQAPGRYIGLVILPLWDQQACAAEIERTAAKGAKGIIFVEDPFKLGLPSFYEPEWDLVYAAAQDADLPLCIHMGSSGWLPPGPPNRPMMTLLCVTSPVLPMMTLADLIGSQAFIRFPRLRVVMHEFDIGWIPHALGRCDFMWSRHGMDGGPGWANPSTPDPPSTYVPDHIWFSLNPAYEIYGPSIIRDVGIDRVVLDVDWPHPDSCCGQTTALVKERLGYLDDDELAKVLRSNAERVFNFRPADVPAPGGPGGRSRR